MMNNKPGRSDRVGEMVDNQVLGETEVLSDAEL